MIHSTAHDNPTNVFTVDVEDYFQVSGFENHICRSTWGEFESRVVASTNRILELLDRTKVRGTFFVLGWIAQHQPGLVQQIAEAGHEIASHGFEHRLIYQQQPEEFRADVLRSKQLLEDLSGQEVISYRAPSFSITSRSAWAPRILVETGYQIDSSIVPGHHDRYGVPHAPKTVHRIATPSGDLTEFPLPVFSMGRLLSLPFGGGGYFRLFPWQVSRNLFRRVNQGGRPFIFYIHPWEVDSQQPRLNAGSRMSRFRHYVNLHRTESRLFQLLSSFQLGRLDEVIGDLSNTVRYDYLTSTREVCIS